MKFRLVSDLHLDFSPYEIEAMGDDTNTVLLLAGDIVELNRKSVLVPFFEDVCDRFKSVVYVFGNHEYYGESFIRAKSRFYETFNADNLYVLQNESIDFGEVVVIGATLWTDLKDGNPMIVDLARRNMADYHHIRTGSPDSPYSRKLHPNDTMKENAYSCKFIFNELANLEDHKKVIVMTHMAPSWKSIQDEYRLNELSYAFANSYESYLLDGLGPDYWVHGHTHSYFQYELGETKVICNPRGYHSIYGNEKTGFNPNLMFEL